MESSRDPRPMIMQGGRQGNNIPEYEEIVTDE